MPTIRDKSIELSISKDASSIKLKNRATGARWVLDPSTVLCHNAAAGWARYDLDSRGKQGKADANGNPYAFAFDKKAGSVEALGDRALIVTKRGAAGEAVMRYELTHEGCRVTLLPGAPP